MVYQHGILNINIANNYFCIYISVYSSVKQFSTNFDTYYNMVNQIIGSEG